MVAVLNEKNITLRLLVTLATITCICGSLNSSIYINQTLLHCIPQELKSFGRTVTQVEQLDEGYFIALETGYYSFRIQGTGPSPFTVMKLHIDSKSIGINFSHNDTKSYIRQWLKVNMEKGSIYFLRFQYKPSGYLLSLPVSVAFNNSDVWSSFENQLVKYDSSAAEDEEHSIYGDWSSWTTCNDTCFKLGMKTRNRVCAQNPLVLTGKIPYEIPDFHNTTECLSNVSCSGVLYTLAPEKTTCSKHCINNQRLCAKEGHDLPLSSAYPVFAALGLTCVGHSADSEYTSRGTMRISTKNECRGFENIPRTFLCIKEGELSRIVCPCVPLPVPPTIVAVEQLNATAISVSVNYSSDNPRLQYYTDFEIRVNVSQRFIIAKSPYAGNTTVTVNGLEIGTLYCIDSVSESANGLGNYSSCYIYETVNVPFRAPANVTASVTNNTSISVQWDALKPSQPHAKLTNYSVYVKLLGPVFSRINTTDRNLTIHGLPVFTLCCVQVSAWTMAGEGPLSDCFNVTTAEGVPSGFPSNVTASGLSSTQISASWDPIEPAQLHGILTYYTVYLTLLKPSSTRKLMGMSPDNQTSVTLPNLEIFTWYCFQVSASTMAGEGPLSECFNVSTSQGVPLSLPLSFAVGYVTSNLVNLVWTRIPSDRNHNILYGYRVRYIACNQLQVGQTPYEEAFYNDSLVTVNITNFIYPYTCYYFQLAGFTESGAGNYTEWINTTTKEQAPSAPPSHLSYQILDTSSVNITWQAIPSHQATGIIRGYSICKWNETHRNCSSRITTCPVKFHVAVFNLTIGTRYCFRLNGFTIAGAGPYSPCLYVMIETAPAGYPQNISARNTSSSSISITWGEVTSDLQNGVIQGYRIFWKEHSSNETNSTTMNASIYSIEVTMLKPFTVYCVQLQAFNSKGNSPLSPCVYVETDEDIPSMAPQNVQIQSTTSTTVELSCSAIPPVHLRGTLLGYNVYIVQCGDALLKEHAMVANVYTSGTFITIFQLSPYTCYSFSLAAFTWKGEGNNSDWVNGTTLDEAPGDIPQGISAHNTSSTSVYVAWKEVPILKRNGITLGYRVFYRSYSNSSTNISTTVDASTYSLEVTSLEKYSNYCIQVLAFNRKGNGPLSVCVNVTTDEDVPSRAPEIKAINTTSKLIHILWNSLPSEYRHGILLGYQILLKKCSSNNVTSWDVEPESARNVSISAIANTCYRCRIAAYTRVGTGIKSDWKNCTTLEGVPDASPQDIKAYSSGTNSINVSWSEVPVSNHNGIILGYRIILKEDLMNETSISATVDNDTFFLEMKGLETYTKYCVEMQAFTKVGDGTLSACVNVTTDEDAPEKPPTDVLGRNLSSSSLEVNWVLPPVSSINGELLGYALSIHRFNDQSDLVERPIMFIFTCAHNTSKVVEDLYIGHLYCVKVALFNKMGFGNYSNCSLVKLNEEVPSSPPTNIQIVDLTPTSFRVTWSTIYWTNRNGVISGYTLIITPYTTVSTTTQLPETTTTTSTAISLLRNLRLRRSVSSEVVINVGPEVRSYLVSNLDKNIEYCVRIYGSTSAGGGNQSDCVVSRTHATDNIIPKLTIWKGSVSVRILLNISDFSYLVSSGFLKYYEVQYKIKSVSGIPVEDGVFTSKFFNATTQTIVLDELSQYTSYVFQAAVITSSGRGNFTQPVVFETCHCPTVFYTNWYAYPPFTRMKNNSQISGIFPSILNDIMRIACGYCDLSNGSGIDYYYDHLGNRESMKNDVDAMKGNITTSVHMSFPLSRRNKELKYQGIYAPLLYIPGLLVISKNESSVEKYARVVAGSIYDIWPVIIINMVTTLLAGTIIWLLERSSNSEQFPVSSLKGIAEGCWWAFITMTTLGYGDRVPITRAGRIFAIIWALVGISIASIMIGSLCSTLTVTVVEEIVAGMARGATIGVVALTPDADVATEVCRGRANVKLFPSISELVTAQRAGEVDSIIVDHFTAKSRTDLFNGTWYKIASVINEPFTYGVLLNGEATKLERYFKEYTATNVSKVIEFANIVEEKSDGSNKTETVRLIIENETINFLDPSSSIFEATFLVLGLTLLAFFLFGLSYHVLIFTKKDNKNLKLVQDYRERMAELKTFLEEFHSQICTVNSRLKRNHSEVLRRVLLQTKKQQIQETNSSYVHQGKLYLQGE